MKKRKGKKKKEEEIRKKAMIALLPQTHRQQFPFAWSVNLFRLNVIPLCNFLHNKNTHTYTHSSPCSAAALKLVLTVIDVHCKGGDIPSFERREQTEFLITVPRWVCGLLKLACSPFLMSINCCFSTGLSSTGFPHLRCVVVLLLCYPVRLVRI